MNNILTQDAPQEQFQPNASKARSKAIKKLIKKYESTIFAFFRELGLPLKYRELIRAYILASNGETSFEASHSELTNLLFRRSATQFLANKETVRHHARSLQDWQKRHHVELIRVVQQGRKIKHPDGSEEYNKTKYELVLLDELVKVLYGCPANEVESKIKEAVGRMKETYIPGETRKEIPTYFLLQRNVKTVFTKFGKAFEQAEQVDYDPVEYCKMIISKLQTTLDEIAEERAEKQNRERLISAFLKSETSSITESYGNGGMEKHHINLQGNSDRNLPSDKRTSPLYTDTETDIFENFLNSKIAEPTDNPLLDSALIYAQAGYPVFPVQNLVKDNDGFRCSCRDWQNCKKQGKHPRTWHGLKDATTDIETIKSWWARWPEANIGLVTGKNSNIFVLDVDPRAGGLYSLEEMQDSYGELPATLTAITGSGGRHFVFKYPNVRVKNSVSLIAPGLDIKSDNGYIIVAPSFHISGNHYQWHGVNTPILDAPDWLIALILLAEEDAEKSKQQDNSFTDDTAAPLIGGEPIREGKGEGRGRNDFLFGQARGLVNSYSPEEVEKRIRAKNLARCVPPLDDKELVSILKSAETYRWKNTKKAA